mgnify:CR=1 FL=1
MIRSTPQPARANVKEPAPSAPIKESISDLPSAVQAEPNDIDAASQRALQLRAGGRRSANERVPRLEYPKRPGWHQCWINDQPGNIQKFKERGYDFRIDPVTKERISRIAGSADGGGGLSTYLMEIPLEIYKDDCKALEAQINAIDAQIRRGAIDGEAKEKGLHVPTNPDGTGRIKIEAVR